MGGRAYINIRGLKKEVAKQYSKKFATRVSSRIRASVAAAKKQMLAEFEQHSVTQDLDSGAGSSNLMGGGDLFSFIGFNSGDRPTNALRAFLLNSLKVSIVRVSNGEVGVEFRINVPTKEQLEGLTPIPWAAGRSWLREVEIGIPGLGQYLVKDSPASRSGAAIQVKGMVQQAEFNGVPYMTKILGNLIKNLTSNLR